jgi:predicted TIM-barrel fold metal-dependent hydrolase
MFYIWYMNRRNFLKSASVSVIASSAYSDSWSQSSSIPIIDTHQHLWNLDLIPLQWVRPPLDQNYLMTDYLKATRGQNLVKAIYMEVGAPSAYKKKEAEWALQLCADPDNPTVGAVISADPTEEGFQSYMKAMEGNSHLKGIRSPFKSIEEMLNPRVIDNIRFLGSIGLSFDLNVNPRLLDQAVELLEKCPETRFILNHCGNADPVAFYTKENAAPREPRHDPDHWYRSMDLLAQQDHLICKISGIVDNVGDYPLSPRDLSPIVDHCYDVFGADRVIFASDWPVCLKNMSLANWVSTLKEVVSGRSLTDQRKLFHDNAQAFYGL